MARNADELKDQITKDLDSMQGQAPGESDTPTETTAEESNPWQDIAEDFENDEDYDGYATSEDEHQEPTTPDATPAEQPAVEDQTPATPDQVADASVETPEQPTPEEPAAPTDEAPAEPVPPRPEVTPEQRKEARDKAVTDLAEHYKISDDEADELVRSPETAYPKFAAKLFMDVFEAVTSSLNNSMPDMITQTTKAQQQQQKAEDTFYESNPQISREHSDLVNKYAQMYVQMNPKATHDQIIKDVGVQVMFKLGIDPRQAQQQQQQRQQQEQQPAPYVPAGAGHVTAPAPTPQHDNPWANMADELMEDD